MATRHSVAPLLLLWAGCAWPSPERQLLLDFFQACRVYDTAVLARLATATCNPRVDGVVQDFQLVSVEEIESGRSAKQVTIDARVRPLGGSVVPQILTITLEEIDGRWMVVEVTQPPASQISPAESSVPPK